MAFKIDEMVLYPDHSLVITLELEAALVSSDGEVVEVTSLTIHPDDRIMVRGLQGHRITHDFLENKVLIAVEKEDAAYSRASRKRMPDKIKWLLKLRDRVNEQLMERERKNNLLSVAGL